MNYRHAFHAASFADVVKHAVLTRILIHLRSKPAAFRVIDTHAGAGLYDLAGPEASRSLEWRAGIHRLLTVPIAEPARALLAPYLDVVAGPHAASALMRNFARDRRVKVAAIDGWTALNAYVPPPERRGLVLVDPAFEDAGDFARLARGLEIAHRKWPTGSYLLWYPIKGREGPDALGRRLQRSGIGKILRAEFSIGATPKEGPLGGCGLILVNPPWTLERELAAMLPELAALLGGKGGGHRLDWLTGESEFRHFSTAVD